MDPKFLEELQKLKEQKNAALEQINLDQLSIPDFEDVEIPTEDFSTEPEEEVLGGTIKFQRVSEAEPEPKAPTPGGRRGRKPEAPVVDEKAKAKKKKITKTVVISTASALVVLSVAFIVFFGVRNANKNKYTYPYWGMGISIENGVNRYSFFGNLKEMIQYGEIGQVEAVAEFKDGNCIKETAYTPEGDVDYFYTHEYDTGRRILSSYHEDGQMVQSVKYTVTGDGKVRSETVYYLEESRVETAVLTLSEEGNLLLAEYYEEGILTKKQTYSGSLVTEEVLYDKLEKATVRIVYEYNGKKQLLTQTEYDGKNTVQGRMVNQYNEKNLLTKTIRYDGAGNILEYGTFNYDLNHNPIKQVQYSGDGTMQSQILKVYNDKNRVVKETSLKSDGSIVYCYGYDYDNVGYVSKSIVYNNENSTVIDRYTLFRRNEAGTVVETTTYNSGNVLVEKSLFNAGGFLVQLNKFNDNGILVLEQKLQYDQKQRVNLKTETVYSDAGQRETYLQEQYNESGLVVNRTWESVKDATYEQTLYEYHKEGWKEQETLFDRSGKTIYDRLFDAQGRTVEETLFEDGLETYYHEYTYKDATRVSEMKTLNLRNGILTKTLYTYNREGILTGTVESNIQNKPLVKKEYDKDGLVTKQTNYEDGTVLEHLRFQYDEEKRVIVREKSNKNGKLVEKTVYYYRTDGGYDYTVYDEKGIAVEDSRGEEFLQNHEDKPDSPSTDNSSDSSENSNSSAN